MRRYELTDNEWERIKQYFPEKAPGTPGRPPKPTRPILNGILWIAGAPWRDLPERFGPWETAYTRFHELIDSGRSCSNFLRFKHRCGYAGYIP